MHYDLDTCTELDCPLCLAINAKATKGGESPVVALGFMVVDAITKLNDKIDNLPAPTATVDLTSIQNEIAQDRQSVDDKFNTFTLALNAKLANLPQGGTAFDPTNIYDTFNDKLDALVLAIDAKIAAIPAPDISAYSTTEDAQSYANDGDAQTLTDANEYADAADALLVEKIAQSHDELVNLIIDHAVPAAAVVAAASFDPKVIDQAKADILALQNADKLQAATAVTGSKGGAASALILWTGTKIQYDALTTKDPGTVYFIQ
jgi:hypothetical protein